MPDFDLERQSQGIVVGVDEAGRGPWAGPVVAAAVNVNPEGRGYVVLEGVNDSKKLSAKKRGVLFENIMEQCDVGVGVVSVEDIDRLNILGATKRAMCLAVENLTSRPDVALVDGNQSPALLCDVQTVVKGDSKSVSIAAASVIAKVTRDRLMEALHQEFPYYGWNTNAGYGTKAHQEGLAQHGITPHHRKSFAPIKKILEHD